MVRMVCILVYTSLSVIKRVALVTGDPMDIQTSSNRGERLAKTSRQPLMILRSSSKSQGHYDL